MLLDFCDDLPKFFAEYADHQGVDVNIFACGSWLSCQRGQNAI